MARKTARKTRPVADPLTEAMTRGDFRTARARAAQLRDDPQASPELRERARELLVRFRLDPVHLAFLGGGLVLWAVAFTLGVLLRK